MTTNQILEKAAALKSKDEQEKRGQPKRGGAWAQMGDPFVDKYSGIGVVISERIRGRPGYSFQIVYFDDHGGNKFIPLPCKGAERPLEEVIYLLVKKAREVIEGKLAEANKREDRQRKDREKRDGKRNERKDRGPTGLSQLSKQDAQKQGKGDEFVGKSERKKKGKSKK